MKQLRLNLILLAVVLVLAGAVYFGQKKEAPKGQPLTALKQDAITRLVLHHPNAPDIVLEKKGSDWLLTAPVQAAADPFELRSLLGVADAETRSSIDPKDVKPADLGLDPPGFSLTLNDVKVDFGGVEPLNYKRYVEVNGRIALVDDPPASALDADYSDLVAKNLFPEGARITAITVPGLKLTRSSDGRGWNADPMDPKAGSDDLQKFSDSWVSARSLWNAATPADAKADPNLQTATVTLDGGATYTFNIVGRDPQLVLERADLKVRYSLAKSDADKLLKLPEPPPAPATQTKLDTPPPKG